MPRSEEHDDGQSEEERLRRLEEKVARLEAQLQEAEREGPPAPAPAAVRPEPVQQAPPPHAPAQWEPGPGPTGAPVRRVSLEERLGANWLSKAGIAVLVLGVLFFFKFAFDAGWIGLKTRVFLGVVGGIGLAILGDLLLTRRRHGVVYPQVLAGGGAVLVYLSVFVAYAFDEYRAAFGISMESTAILLATVAILTAGYATWRDTPILAMVAAGLVAWTVLFARTWHEFSVIYLVMAIALLLLAAVFRRWRDVPAVLVVPAYLPLVVFLLQDFAPWWVVGGACALFVIYAAAGLTSRIGQATNPADIVTHLAVPLATWGLTVAALSATGNRDLHEWITLGAALLLGGLAFAARNRPALCGAWSITAMFFALVWAPIAFDGTGTVYAWAFLGAVGVAVAVWRRNHWTEAGVLAPIVLMAVHLGRFELPRLVQDDLDFGAAVAVFGVATAVTAAAWILYKAKERNQTPVGLVVLGIGVLLPVMLFGGGLEGYGVSIAWTLLATTLVGLGFALGIPDLRFASFAVFGLVLARVFLIDIQDLEPVYRVITFLVVGSLLLVVSFLFARRRKAA